MDLHIRSWNREDIPDIVRYWTSLSDADAERMGAELSRFPTTEEYIRILEGQLHQPPEQTNACYSMWVMDGRTIGFASLKNIRFGIHGEMHLHIWEAMQRGKGIGAKLFCLSAVDFHERFKLGTVICEPSAGNPLPNRMLQKIGFARIGSRFGRSSDLSAEQELNTYAISREVALKYLLPQGEGGREAAG